MDRATATAALGCVAAVVAGLTGCTGQNQHTGPGMMGAGGMYHDSPLSCSAPTSLPGNTVTVRLTDMGMTQMMGGVAPLSAHMRLRGEPVTVRAGRVSLIAENRGWRTHEVLVIPIRASAQAGQRTPGPGGKIDETGSLAEASASCAAGTGKGITAGAVGWTTVELPAGRYELVCNVRNHYADGMHQELDVTSS